MKFPSPLLKGTLIRWYRRSLADVRLENGKVVTAHVFGTGRLTGCSMPGSKVLLSDSGDRSRKNRLTWELIEVDGKWIGVNPKVSRLVFLDALAGGHIDTLRGYRIEGELTGRNRKADIVLQSMDDNYYVMLQSVSRALDGSALVPDGENQSARRSLERLTEQAAEGHRALALFHVLRSDCERLKVAADDDPKYARALSVAQRKGVELHAYRATVSPIEVTLGPQIPFLID